MAGGNFLQKLSLRSQPIRPSVKILSHDISYISSHSRTDTDHSSQLLAGRQCLQERAQLFVVEPTHSPSPLAASLLRDRFGADSSGTLPFASILLRSVLRWSAILAALLPLPAERDAARTRGNRLGEAYGQSLHRSWRSAGGTAGSLDPDIQ